MEAPSIRIPHHLVLLPEHLSASDRNNHNRRTNFNLHLKNPILARLEQCSSMRRLRQLHAQMITTGLVHETFAASRLIAFCGLSLHGDLHYALKLFPQVSDRNLFLWNLMIRAFSRSNHPELSLRFYVQMLESGCAPDSYTFPFLLKSCSHLTAAEEEGRQVHAHLVKAGLEADPFVSNSLVNMYSESGRLEMAKAVFLRMSGNDERPGQVSLATMIGGLISNGCPEEAIALFCSKNWRQWSLDQITLATVLSACARGRNLKLGKEIHCYIEEHGSAEMGLVVCNSLMNMYAKCGELATARTLFERMPSKDSVSWNVMISGLAENGYIEEGLELLSEMRPKRNVSADQATFLSLVSSCDRLSFARRIHAQVEDTGFDSDVPICNALIDTYSRIGHAELAERVFEGMRERDVITWNSMIGGYTRCGSMGTARSLFGRMPVKDNVSWSTMILGYVRNDQPKEAISIYRELRTEGFIEPDSVTLVSALTACSSLGALEEGRAIHDYIRNSNHIELDSPLATALVDMYSKCGCLASALQVFHGTAASGKDVLAWTAMISGFATNGDAEGALRLFKAMTVEHNSVTFLAVLTACAHAGLVEEGKSVYSSMIEEHRLEPGMAHLGCMVDLLGRAGRLDEALEFIIARCGDGVQVDVSVWGALLGACKIHGNVGMGEMAARKMIELEPMHRGAHVLMSNMYAEAGRWDERRVVRRKMSEEKESMVKEVGISWIEVGGTLQEFAAGNM